MIAVLGASGYVGGSLARRLAALGGAPIVLFSREPEVRLGRSGWPADVGVAALDEFRGERFDLVVNAIGAGDPADVARLGPDVLALTAHWDEVVLSGLRPDARYVFLSSGAVHLPADAWPGEGVPPYVLAKQRAEARHRALPDRSILDVRIFGYADEAIDTRGTSFLAELAASVVSGSRFLTAPGDMVRDYAGAEELLALILAWQGASAPNLAVDLCTASATTKGAILDAAVRLYGIEVVRTGAVGEGPTGRKPLYVPRSRVAAALGFRPARTSLEIVLQVLAAVSARQAPAVTPADRN